jgi:hypothetical protein
MEHDASVFAAGVDAAGRRSVGLTLGDQNVPLGDAVGAIQDRFALGSSSSAGAIQFLLAMKSSNASISISVFEGLKSSLDELVQNMDQELLEMMLDCTIAYVELPDLQAIPMSVMKRLPTVHRRHLAYLVEKDVISVRVLYVVCCMLYVDMLICRYVDMSMFRCVDVSYVNCDM